MTDEANILEVIYKEIDQFVEEWRTSPFEWDTEADIHVDVSSRIKEVIKLIDADSQKVKYDGHGLIKVSLISNEYRVFKGSKSKNREYCKPDILVFKRIVEW